MNRIFSIAFGLTLCLFGLLLLGLNLLAPLFWPGFSVLQFWRLWPLLLLAAGAGMCLGGLGAVNRPGLGGLFIPGVMLLVNGGILTLASLSGRWEIWAWAWPFELLGLAAAFGLAALAMRVVWLLIPAILIGLNGIALAFTTWTGLWGAWAALWAIEPLAIGLILLLTAWQTRSLVTGVVGAVFCGLAALAFAGVSALMVFGPWLLGVLPALALIAVGAALLALPLLRRVGPLPRPLP